MIHLIIKILLPTYFIFVKFVTWVLERTLSLDNEAVLASVVDSLQSLIVLGEKIKEKAIYIEHNSREKLGEKQGENLCENHFLFSPSTQAFLLAFLLDPKNVFPCPWDLV